MKKKFALIFVAAFALCAVLLAACDPDVPQPNSVTVSFDVIYSGGTNPQSQTVAEGSTIYLPSASRSGYIFDGWYTASSDGELAGKAGEGYVANSDVTLFAHWTEEQPEDPVDPLLELIGKIKQEHSKATNTNENYTLHSVYAVILEDTGATVVYVKWTVAGSDTVTVGDIVNGKVTVSVPSVRNTDIAYTLKATLVDESNVAFTDGSGAKYSAEFNHVAQKNTATVTFAINYDGGVNPQSQTVVVGKTIELPNVTRDEQEFVGWYTNSSDGDFVGVAGDSYVVNSDVTLYAHWKKLESKTIVFYSAQGSALQELTEQAIRAFEEKYPDWTVEHIAIGSYEDVYTQTLADLQLDQQPDLVYCYPDHVATYITSGKVVDINKYVNSTATVNGNLVGFTALEQADFVQSLWNEGLATNYGGYALYGYSDDSMLTLPFVRSTDVMYYNKTALDALGLSVATTWDELWQQCATIKSRYPTSTPLGYDSESNWFITMCHQNGWGYTSASGEHYLFNNENTQAWLTQLNTYWGRGYVTTQKDFGNYMSVPFVRGVDNGGLVYCIASSAGAAHQDPRDSFEYGVTSVPGSGQANGSINYGSVCQGPSLVMLDSGYVNATEKEKMTFLFVKELLSPEFQAEFAMASAYMPVRSSVYDLAAYQQFLDGDSITAQVAQLCQEIADDIFTTPAFVGSATARMQVGDALLFAMNETMSADKALGDAYKNCVGR